MWSLQHWTEGNSIFPQSAGHTLPIVGQCAVCFFRNESSLLDHVQLSVHCKHQALFSKAATQPFPSQPALMYGVTLSQMQRFALLELNVISAGQVVQCLRSFWNDCRITFYHSFCPTQVTSPAKRLWPSWFQPQVSKQYFYTSSPFPLLVSMAFFLHFSWAVSILFSQVGFWPRCWLIQEM